MRDDLRRHWALDPEVAFLNHGSFGACPTRVLESQTRWRQRMERQPIQFFVRELEALVDRCRAALGALLGAEPENLAWVNNATTGVNAVLRSVHFEPGDQFLVTDHEYNASRNALDFVAGRSGAEVVVASLPFPVTDPQEVVDALVSRVDSRTRLLLVDHVTSQTGMVLPLQRIVAEMDARGVDVLVDGAHGPGMLPLELERLGAAYYTGNCHKWLCAPKGAAFLYVRPDRQDRVRPVVISHGANSPRRDRSRFLVEFDWVGTDDPTAVLCVPDALEFLQGLFPGGWDELRRHNHRLVLQARDLICEVLGVTPPVPDSMIGSLASIPLPPGEASDTTPGSPLYVDPLQDRLLELGVEVPVIPWPAAPQRLVRLSAQAYNRPEDYERLARGLRRLLG